MEIERGPEPWQPKITVEGPRAVRVVSLLKAHNTDLTATLALAAFAVGTLSIFIVPWLQWLRWALSFVTFLAAVVTTGRCLRAEVAVSGASEDRSEDAETGDGAQ
ncbi:uncharacterized protein Nmlp_1185 [Natronomonas moolapensis 8.8.11]|uniref:Uncharacterized protein n=1 Tax=Natronomonas moolapensis (strain DSM 18674 / CECT 7526 / JCM 14361 / 8.8.11) TaxID=268739 RepID=M1XNC7_NATM8|nr:hypothetical protein [Natronomonas moolapensis]CCQ35395.1 uncharacterized protein Nmlp_1185 [Natronomonas moolapensis 8.8.11]